MARILIVDDEPDVCEYLAEVLKQDKFEVQALTNTEKFKETLESFRPDAVLLDYNMPGQSGVELMRGLRKDPKWKSLAIIMVTGVSSEAEKILALDMGADDYVVKPFNPRELAARIRSVLRRRAELFTSEKVEAPGIIVDLKSHKVLVDQKEVHLTLTEFKILTELIRQQGQVLSRDQLREVVVENLTMTDRTIDVHMTSLRKKLGRFQFAIETVRGVGYRYAPTEK